MIISINKYTFSLSMLTMFSIFTIATLIESLVYYRTKNKILNNTQQKLAHYTTETAQEIDTAIKNMLTEKNITIEQLSTADPYALTDVINTNYTTETGYWFLLSTDGTFLAHPEKKFIKNKISVFDKTKMPKNKHLKKAVKQAVIGKATATFYRNEINNSPSWLFMEFLPKTNLIVGHSFDLSELDVQQESFGKQLPDVERQHLMIIVVLASIACFALLLALFARSSLQTVVLWYGSAAISLLLVVTITLLWYITYHYPNYQESLVPISGKRGLANVINTSFVQNQKNIIEPSNLATPRLNTNPLLPIIIPTGIYLNQIRFTNDNKIEIIGYIWQHYVNVPSSIARRCILPQASRSKINELQAYASDAHQKIVWSVEAILDQDLFYTNYPFDVKDLQIQIAHPDLEAAILLVPDFSSYKLLTPLALPGINPRTRLASWNLEGTYFRYQITEYDNLFGMYDAQTAAQFKNKPDNKHYTLSYNIMIKRRIMDTLIADLIPLAVIASLLFVILITAAQQGVGLLGSVAGVFFGTILEHERFRAKAGSYALVFFENMYLIMYITILAIVVVSLMYLLHSHLRFIRYRTNLISQLLFWPIVLISVIVVSLVYLY